MSTISRRLIAPGLMSTLFGCFTAPAPSQTRHTAVLSADGLKDDTYALQELIDKSRGARLVIPPGIFRITRPLIIDTGYTQLICGAGSSATPNAGTTIVNNHSGAALMIVNPGKANDNIHSISDLTISGGGGGVICENAHRVILSNLWITDAKYDGILLRNSWVCKVRDTVVTHCGGSGIRVSERGNIVVISDCTTTVNGSLAGANIKLEGIKGGENLTVNIDSTDFSSAERGLEASYTTNLRVTGCYSEQCGDAFYCDETVQNLVFSSNYIQDGNATIVGASPVNIFGNTIAGLNRRAELRLSKLRDWYIGPNDLIGNAGIIR